MRGTFNNVGSVLRCYSLTSSPPTPPQLPVPSESSESDVQVPFEGNDGRRAAIHVGGHLKEEASGLEMRMLGLYESRKLEQEVTVSSIQRKAQDTSFPQCVGRGFEAFVVRRHRSGKIFNKYYICRLGILI